MQLSPDSTDANKEGYIVVNSGFRLNIQPMKPELVALSPYGDQGKLFTGFTSTPGIKESMVISTAGTTTISGMRLRVIGVEQWVGPLGLTVELALLQPKQ